MIIYGIKTCSSVQKAVKFMKQHALVYELVDYKVTSVGEEKIREWLESVELATLFNKRGKKYRDLGLKELTLTEEEMITWLAKENYLLKRPVIEYGEGKLLVGFDSEVYEEALLRL